MKPAYYIYALKPGRLFARTFENAQEWKGWIIKLKQEGWVVHRRHIVLKHNHRIAG